MAEMKCEICGIVFEGRPNRRYCSIDCRRTAEMAERVCKRKARYDAWLASLSPEDRVFYDDLKEFSTEGLKEFEIKPPVKGQKRRKKR